MVNVIVFLVFLTIPVITIGCGDIESSREGKLHDAEASKEELIATLRDEYYDKLKEVEKKYMDYLAIHGGKYYYIAASYCMSDELRSYLDELYKRENSKEMAELVASFDSRLKTLVEEFRI